MPRVGAKARRRAHARRIARHLFEGSTGSRATRLVLVLERPGLMTIDLGGWCEQAVAELLEAELRPGQRRRAAR
jgi:hypothetical protein